jgi:hypothetical protein
MLLGGGKIAVQIKEDLVPAQCSARETVVTSARGGGGMGRE